VLSLGSGHHLPIDVEAFEDAAAAVTGQG